LFEKGEKDVSLKGKKELFKWESQSVTLCRTGQIQTHWCCCPRHQRFLEEHNILYFLLSEKQL